MLRNHMEARRDYSCSDTATCLWDLESEDLVSKPGTAYLPCSL